MARGKARPSTRYILPNGTYVIIYEDGTGEMKFGFLDRDTHLLDHSTSTDGSRIIVQVTERADAKAPTPRGNDVVVGNRSW